MKGWATVFQREKSHELLTVLEAVDFLRISRPQLYRFLKAGKLKGYKVGRDWRFFKRELIDFVRRGANTDPSREGRAAVPEKLLPAATEEKKPARLDKAQVKIVALVAMGLTNQEIADKLGIVERTVKNQLYTAFKICGVRSRTDLVSALFGGRLAPEVEGAIHDEMNTKAPSRSRNNRSPRRGSEKGERTDLPEQEAEHLRAG